MTDADRTDLQLLQRPVTRRGALALLGGLGVLAAGCSGGSDGSSATATTALGATSTTSGATTTTTGSAAAAVTSCAEIPEETAGPFPGDGSNGPDALSEAASEANFLRGVQAADANGLVSFTSIFPAAYSGRWPHVHFEVYSNVDAATSGGTKLATSQIALPKDVCDAVYATIGYEQSVTNLARTSLSSDMVFSDGVSLQTPSMTGNVTSGYVSSLVVGVAGTV